MSKVTITSRTPLPWNASWMTTTSALLIVSAAVELEDKNAGWTDTVWFAALFTMAIVSMATAAARWVEYADRIASHRRAKEELAKAVSRQFPPRGM